MGQEKEKSGDWEKRIRRRKEEEKEKRRRKGSESEEYKKAGVEIAETPFHPQQAVTVPPRAGGEANAPACSGAPEPDMNSSSASYALATASQGEGSTENN